MRPRIERAEARGVANALLFILEERIGSPPTDLTDAVNAITDAKRLEGMVPFANRAATFEQFRQQAGL
jgi:hypothetical protein